MNAPDSSPPPEPRPLSDGVRGSLRDAIELAFRNDAGAESRLGAALRDAAAEARERGLRPEELIVALKALLDDVQAGASTLGAREQTRIRDRIVSACITAYFRAS